MDIATMHFWGKTKYWWALIITGILMIPCGLWLWFQPAFFQAEDGIRDPYP